MKKLFFAATAACGLAVATVPAVAQMNSSSSASMQMTSQQQQMYNSWTAEQRTTYDAWPAAAKEYYWSLNDAQKNVWWNRLNNEQRVRIVNMAPQQRTAAWSQIDSQVTANLTGSATASSNMSGNRGMSGTRINFVSNEMVQNIAADQAAYDPNGNVPVCGANDFDNCINRGAR